MTADPETRGPLCAGAATTDITPLDPQFLFGYPHVERYSTGVHDPLFSSALYLSDGVTEMLFIANDIIFVGKPSAVCVRTRIADATSVPESNIMVSATHTHSGPITVDYLSNEGDAAISKADPGYVAFLEDRIVEAGVRACRSAESARVGLAIASGAGVGTNRRDPNGPSDPEVPVLMVRSADGSHDLACMLVYSMHPTVLHEDSTSISADFPGMARQHLLQHAIGPECVVLYHTGPAGNQSCRHVARENTFGEARRLGRILGESIATAMASIHYTVHAPLRCQRGFVDLPRRIFPTVEEAESSLADTIRRLDELRRSGAPRPIVRTAECNWFGAEEMVALARAAMDGRLDAAYASCLPAEVQVFRIGPWTFVAWPGEIFVEYALEVKGHNPHTFIISLANGELQGYIVTEEAAREGGYEAANALFGPEAGKRLVETTLQLMAEG